MIKNTEIQIYKLQKIKIKEILITEIHKHILQK